MTRAGRRSALLFALLAAVGLALTAVRWRYGGGSTDFPDRTTAPILPATALEVVADLELPPGNIAISPGGRTFFSFHPEARPTLRVAELVEGKAIPYPSRRLQGPGRAEVFFDAVLSLRVDRRNRLWTLDNGRHGMGQPRLLAFDLATDELAHRFEFPPEMAGLGSHLNDFQVNPDGRKIYIADASILAKSPAILAYDVETGACRRLLEGHPSVEPERFIPVVQGRTMEILGIFAVRPGVDSIVLDHRGEWLYYAAVTSRELYRVRTRDLDDPSLSAAELAARVERYAAKTMSDGIAIDLEDGIYLTDLEHSAIVRLRPDRALETLIVDPRLRWPDGLGFGPDGQLYVTASALHQVIGHSRTGILRAGPFQIFRFWAPAPGVAGH